MPGTNENFPGWLGHGTEHVVRHSSASLCTSIESVRIFYNELRRRHNCNTNLKACPVMPQVLFRMACSRGSGNERSFSRDLSLRNILLP